MAADEPLQNRVTPEGDIVAVAARGTFMGNRGGRMHTADRKLTRSRWKSRAWITCVLEFKNRHNPVMRPNRYTELFFLDEATALAAGHRPCFECRRADANAFFAAWDASGLAPEDRLAGDLDRVLHAERVAEGRRKRMHKARLDTLPDGAMVLLDGEPHLVAGSHLLAWSHGGYTRPSPHDGKAQVSVLTPPTTLQILRAGYLPHVHDSARPLAGDHGMREA